jgi:hypothetical protein
MLDMLPAIPDVTISSFAATGKEDPVLVLWDKLKLIEAEMERASAPCIRDLRYFACCSRLAQRIPRGCAARSGFPFHLLQLNGGCAH